MNTHTLGEISLNISFFLYLFLYVPQFIRNIRYKRLNDMSLGFHALLLIASTADFYYGFGRIHQWQYRVVTLLMFALVFAQHIQLFYYRHYFKYGTTKLIVLSLFILVMILFLIPTLTHPLHWMFLFIWMGWLERLCDWSYCIPQFIKNRQINHADAISPTFLIIAILTPICDSISAWCFHWGPSSLYGAPIAIILHAALLIQWYHGIRRKPRLHSS
jgi:uncharacterized protein with PQ loop repeat